MVCFCAGIPWFANESVRIPWLKRHIQDESGTFSDRHSCIVVARIVCLHTPPRRRVIRITTKDNPRNAPELSFPRTRESSGLSPPKNLWTPGPDRSRGQAFRGSDAALLAGVEIVNSSLSGISNNTRLPLGSESLKHVNQKAGGVGHGSDGLFRCREALRRSGCQE